MIIDFHDLSYIITSCLRIYWRNNYLVLDVKSHKFTTKISELIQNIKIYLKSENDRGGLEIFGFQMNCSFKLSWAYDITFKLEMNMEQVTVKLGPLSTSSHPHMTRAAHSWSRRNQCGAPCAPQSCDKGLHQSSGIFTGGIF